MIEFFVYLFFLVSFFLLIKLRWKFIFYLPVFNLIADMSFTFFPGYSAPTIMRAAIIIMFMFYAGKGIFSVKIKKYFFFFFALMLIMLVFSEEFVYSLRVSIQVILSMTMFLVGYTVFSKMEGFNYLINNLKPLVYLAIIATVTGYLFEIGKELEYTTSKYYNAGAENVGLLGSGGLFAPAIVIGILPFLIKIQNTKRARTILIISSALLFLLILLNVRRTAIIIPLIGLSGFLIYLPLKSKIRTLQYVLVIAAILVLAYPLYNKILSRRYEFRKEQGRFEKDFYKSESRYVENINMLEAISRLDELPKVFIGYGNNLFADQYENGVVSKRMIHSDLPKIFYSIGIFGLILYLVIYFSILKEINSIPNHGFFRDLKAACFGLFLISVFVSINGSITLFSFRTLNFLLLGAFIGYAHKLMISIGEFSTDREG